MRDLVEDVGETIATTLDGFKGSAVLGHGFQVDQVAKGDFQMKCCIRWVMPMTGYKFQSEMISGGGQEWKPWSVKEIYRMAYQNGHYFAGFES